MNSDILDLTNTKSGKNNKGFEETDEVVDWKDYSDFEFYWINTILRKNILSRSDLLLLLDKFEIVFLPKNWSRNFSTEEFGGVLLHHVPKKELWPLITELLETKYEGRITFEEASDIYYQLSQLNKTELLNLFRTVPAGKRDKIPSKYGEVEDNIAALVKNKKREREVEPDWIIDPLFTRLCRMPKAEVYKLFGAYFLRPETEKSERR